MKAIEKSLLKINSWDAFFTYANSLTKDQKGYLFERLTFLILTTKPEYSSLLKKVWFHRGDISKSVREKLNLPRSDEGIDLIAETIRGEYWAIQCKFKGQNQAPTYKEISTFTYLANSYCENISLALLVHSGEKGVKKKALLGKKYSEIGLDFWLGLTKEDWSRIHKKIKKQSTRPIPRKPKLHQDKAIEAAKKYFLKTKERRGRLIMPCGTGKSLTAFWIANTLNARFVIVAVPSLSLIKESLEDWTRELVALDENPKPEWLVICSDESTAKLDQDEFVSDTYSLGIPTTTDVNEISIFLNETHKGRKIIFTTYQSCERLAIAARNSNFRFDLAIMDEAHKTVGEKSKSYSILLSDKNISINKRLFMTATERIMKGKNDDVYSMDDESVYGKRFFQLTFKSAIYSDPQIICDYKVVTITVTNEEIQNLIAKNKLIIDKSKNLDEQESQSMAAAIALRRATKKYRIKHAISFHRSIKTANDFSILNHKLNVSKIDDIDLKAYHISSKKSAGERAQLMADFTNEKVALMTNARCLTEGVNVPAIDCVLFADPKQSVIDIVQAAGRALRPYSNKEFGYIMLPIIVPDGMDIEMFTETTSFRQVAKIITALSTQDERIAEEFRITDIGKRTRGNKIIIEGTIPIGLNIDLSNFAQKINARIWDKVSKANWRPFDEARKHVRSLKLVNGKEWKQFCKSKNKPEDIPAFPNQTYKNKGWVSMGDWLGTGNIADQLRQYRFFSEARKYVHSLKLMSGNEWQQFCKSGGKPEDIPAFPNQTYKNKGWISMGDWLGTGNIANQLKEYRSFNDARKYVHSLKLNSRAQWNKYCRSGNKPDDIPATPKQNYKNKGWMGMGDWLGTGTIAPFLRKYQIFAVARTYVHSLKLKNSKEWQQFCKSGKKAIDIPAAPNRIYKNKGWISMGDWLGTGVVADKLKVYMPFNNARKYVHSLKLKSTDEWKLFCKSGKKPKDIPNVPYLVYKDKGWISMGDWLGTGIIATQLKKYKPFQEAKKYVRSLKLKNGKEWNQYCKSEKKQWDIPVKPEKIYKYKGWISIGDWLGTNTVATFLRQYRSFKEARKYVHTLQLKKLNEWQKYCTSGNKPIDIPSAPSRVYKNKGWISMGDWLGTRVIAGKLKEYMPFDKAKEYIHSLKLKNRNEWNQFCKSGKKPGSIPNAPNIVYRSNGWISIGDWLGTGNIANHLKKYRSFEEARKYVHSLRLKSAANWNQFCKSGGKPLDVPSVPDRVYKNKGWVNWGHWLGTGSIASKWLTIKRKTSYLGYLPFREARAYIHSLHLQNGNGWRQYCKVGKRPENIPNKPERVYKNNGWVSMGDWVGSTYIAPFLRKYKPFDEAINYARSLKLKNITEWNEHCKSGKKPEDIPANPNQVYRNEGWKSIGDWLGTGNIAPTLKVFKTFLELKNYVQTLKLKNVAEWIRYCKSGKRPEDIPTNPDRTYRQNGWVSWGDFLGTGIVANQFRGFKSFEEARLYVHSLKLKSSSDWYQFRKSGIKPKDIPSNPNEVYRNNGWINMGDWLGTGSIAPRLRKYRSYDDAKEYVCLLDLKNSYEWRKFSKAGNKPDDIPAAPNRTYQKSGWIGWGDWLGKNI